MSDMMSQSVYWIHGVGPAGEDGRSTPQTDDDWYHRLPLVTVGEMSRSNRFGRSDRQSGYYEPNRHVNYKRLFSHDNAR
ncbi:MAG: hypothetical protein M5U34_49355 [Chloroflexi bacterium]|nr:hypothetical protein [Chloroflexota bacterium]